MRPTGVLIETPDGPGPGKPVRHYITFAGGTSGPDMRIEVVSEHEAWKGIKLINKEKSNAD